MCVFRVDEFSTKQGRNVSTQNKFAEYPALTPGVERQLFSNHFGNHFYFSLLIVMMLENVKTMASSLILYTSEDS